MSEKQVHIVKVTNPPSKRNMDKLVKFLSKNKNGYKKHNS